MTLHADTACAALLDGWPGARLSPVAERVLAEMVRATRIKADKQRDTAEHLAALGAIVRIRVAAPTVKAARCTASDLRAGLAELVELGYLAPRHVGTSELYTVEVPA